MQELERLTIGQVLEKSAAESPDKVAVVDGGSWKTYSELNAMADALAAGLADIGYNYLAEILKIKKELPELKSIIVADHGMGEGVYSFEALMDKGSERKFPAGPIDPQEDLCMLLYTSGTTGQPKGAMITHYAAVRAAWEYSLGVQATSKDIFIGMSFASWMISLNCPVA